MMDKVSQSLATDRRQLLHYSGIPLLAWAAGPTMSWAAADSEAPLSRFPRMVHEFFVRQVRELEQRNHRIKRNLNSRSDAENYVRQVREKIRLCFGPFPARTPLNATVTGILTRPTHRIEKVIFESRPGFPVTANLYLPSKISQPVPGVVGTCGHSSNGKAEPAYQAFAQGLARQGYACLLYDPIGQGERLQYVDKNGQPRLRPGTREHLYAGNQQFLVGQFFGSWRAWDGVRALDYLLTRKEVDSTHLGVTGNSGGGTMTTWLCGLERRWTMAAPSCFVTTFRHNLENELPADTEQCPPRALALGLDHEDFLAAMAPKPTMILAKERDFFDVRGSEAAFQRLQRLYRLLGAEEKSGLFVGPTTHGFSKENREAMYAWFHRSTGISHSPQEADSIIEKDKDLQCTPTGQVATLPGTRTVFDFTRETSSKWRTTRKPIDGVALTKTVREVLKLPGQSSSTPEYRIWRHLGSRGYPAPHAVAYGIETEKNVQAIVYRLTQERWQSRPPRTKQPATLYIAHLSSDQELREEPLIKEIIRAQPNHAFYTCDVRGIGESLPGTCSPGSFHSPYGSDYFYAIHSLMLDRPYLGQKTFDVLRVLDWLTSIGHPEVHLIGKGWGSLAATFAALLAPSVRQVTLKHALTAYSDIAESEYYSWPLATLLPGVLSQFDLPDCYRNLAAKQLRMIAPWGAEAT